MRGNCISIEAVLFRAAEVTLLVAEDGTTRRLRVLPKTICPAEREADDVLRVTLPLSPFAQ